MQVRSGPATVTRALITTSKIREVRTSAGAGRRRIPRAPTQPRHAAGVDTRRKGVRCGRFRSPQSLAPKTWHSP